MQREQDLLEELIKEVGLSKTHLAFKDFAEFMIDPLTKEEVPTERTDNLSAAYFFIDNNNDYYFLFHGIRKEEIENLIKLYFVLCRDHLGYTWIESSASSSGTESIKVMASIRKPPTPVSDKPASELNKEDDEDEILIGGYLTLLASLGGLVWIIWRFVKKGFADGMWSILISLGIFVGLAIILEWLGLLDRWSEVSKRKLKRRLPLLLIAVAIGVGLYYLT